MKLSIMQLREVIRSAINEMPLARLYEPRHAKRSIYVPPTIGKSGAGDESDEDDFDFDFNVLKPSTTQKKKIKSLFRSKSYKQRLEKLLSGWPNPVFWLPYTADYTLSSDRSSEIVDPSTALRKVSDNPELTGAIRVWMDEELSKDPNATLVITVGRLHLTAAQVTPWMTLHALFDRGDALYEDEPPAPGTETATEIATLVGDFIESLPDEFVEGRGFDMLEQVFTFGSARMKYATRVRVKTFPRGKGTFSDARNEAAVQSLTKRGFQYDREALNALIEAAEEEGFDTSDVNVAALDEAERLSTKSKQEFFNVIKGNVIIVDV